MKKLLMHCMFIATGTALCMLSGCAPLTPNLDSKFGDSLNAAKRQQTIDPMASNNTASPSQDGQAAGEAMGQYYQSFSTPAAPQNVFTIGVSSH